MAQGVRHSLEPEIPDHCFAGPELCLGALVFEGRLIRKVQNKRADS